LEENDLVENEMDDTAASPSKKRDEVMDDQENSDPGAKRRLSLTTLSVENLAPEEPDLPAAMVVDGSLALHNLLAEEETNDRTKRSKKEGAISTSLGSAGSREGSVRSQ
jgi:hypothetical protein